MRSVSWIRRRGNGGERGAVGLETALVMLILVPVVFGIVEYSLLFTDWIAVTSSVRAGARVASSEPREATFAQDAADQVAKGVKGLNMANLESMWVFKANPTTGAPDGGLASCSDCAKFTWDAANQKLTKVSDNWSGSSQSACAGQPRDNVGVYLRIKHDSVTGMIFPNFTIGETAVMNLEPIPSTLACKP